MNHLALPVRLATSVLRLAPARQGALWLAAARRAALVLVYHRVAPHGAAPHEVVPTIASALLREHLEALTRLGTVVPLSELLEPSHSSRRARFAVTFDDDHVGHSQHALPILQSVGVTATFFLSGRTLHGLPPYWWTFVEESIRLNGLPHTARALGLNRGSPATLAGALEHSSLTERLHELLPQSTEPQMSADDIRRLSDAGMTIGFHTLRHARLSDLSGTDLSRAMTEGLTELAAAAGAPVNLLAYPYGRAIRPTADAAERAGYRAAFASGGHPVGYRSDPFLLGRWDPGPMDIAEFTAAVTLRLLRRKTGPRPRGSAHQP